MLRHAKELEGEQKGAPTDQRPLDLVACCPGAAALVEFKRRFKKGRSGRTKGGSTLGIGSYGPIIAPSGVLQPQLLDERARPFPLEASHLVPYRQAGAATSIPSLKCWRKGAVVVSRACSV